MEIEIMQIKDKAKYEINGKLIYKDQAGKWQCHSILLPIEKEAFKKLVSLKFNDPRIKIK